LANDELNPSSGTEKLERMKNSDFMDQSYPRVDDLNKALDETRDAGYESNLRFGVGRVRVCITGKSRSRQKPQTLEISCLRC